ncbi:MAG: CpaF family protein [Deltaproteobacteria bacterium]|nr:MAG: CpaF family protein [Deltaproteobacteria bacterium]
MDSVMLRRAVEEGVWETFVQAEGSGGDLHAVASWIAHQRAQGTGMAAEEVHRVVQDVTEAVRRYDLLWPLMFDPHVTEIMVNGPDRIFIEREGRMEATGLRYRSAQQLLATVERIVSVDPHARLDGSRPMVDVALPDGSRANIAIPPVVQGGAHLTIRKYQGRFESIQGMVNAGSMDERMATLLRAATQARLNILFSGGAGSGKTTLLEVLSRNISREERIVCIEDALEIHLQHPHVVRMLTRERNIEGKGEITIGDLFRNCLRMRPSRILLGEIRGKEAFDYLQALNGGHQGTMAVIHASSPEEAVLRLQNLVPLAGLSLPNSVVGRQIAHGIHLIVQHEQLPGGQRKISRLTEVFGVDEHGEVRLRDLFVFRPQAMGEGRFEAMGVVPEWFQRVEWSGFHCDREMFQKG